MQKLKRGDHFGVLTGMSLFSVYNRAKGNQLKKATGEN